MTNKKATSTERLAAAHRVEALSSEKMLQYEGGNAVTEKKNSRSRKTLTVIGLWVGVFKSTRPGSFNSQVVRVCQKTNLLWIELK